MSIWDNKGHLDTLEEQRDLKRKSGKLTFDCFNLKCRGNRAYCAKGIRIGRSKDGSMGLITVLRGRLSASCRECKWFDNGEQAICALSIDKANQTS